MTLRTELATLLAPSRRATTATRRYTTSAEWVQHFQQNAASVRPVPWHLGHGATTQAQMEAIMPSLRAWQLGETSDGAHLIAAARDYAQQVGDLEFLDAVRLFIAEEQRHGEALGLCVDLAIYPRAQKNWGDTLFRRLRYVLPRMEVWATPVVMVETHAMIFYRALRQASPSPVLRAVCEQILADEVPHIRFQCERLAILHRQRSWLAYALTMLLHRLLFAGVTLLIWAGHRRALQAGGFHFRRFWHHAWSRMGFAWRLMNPRLYAAG